ncbi:hypothetical protein CAPN004_03310 [Capnocytophaga cynodegmi]|uniref:hypothetical protein n=1 Tax=Capnocytophaga cynodegmi TaxID=28189 RepID=UPI001AD5F86A|nr:hypothetical protein [Capnocytophaga cynodegmi]GIM51301.1 hypothetical protein CAPN004_03310 [Capnocytophaga cynodegmi]
MKKILTLFSVFSFIFLSAQEDKKGHLFFNLNVGYHIPTIYHANSSGESNKYLMSVETDSPVLGFGASYFIKENLSVGFENTIRRSFFDYGNPSPKTFQSDIYIFQFDYHLFAEYYFTSAEECDFFVRFGISAMGKGASATYKSASDSGITPIDLSYYPLNYAIGYKIKNFNILLGAHTAFSSDFETKGFTIPYLRMGYNIGKLF